MFCVVIHSKLLKTTTIQENAWRWKSGEKLESPEDIIDLDDLDDLELLELKDDSDELVASSVDSNEVPKVIEKHTERSNIAISIAIEKIDLQLQKKYNALI